MLFLLFHNIRRYKVVLLVKNEVFRSIGNHNIKWHGASGIVIYFISMAIS